MSQPATSTPVQQFLVAPRTPDQAGQADLQRFAEKAEATDQAAIVQQVGTPVPTRLVVTMPPALAESFQREFRSLIIEENAPLTL